MRHRREGKKFHRKQGARRAFLKNLITQVIWKERVETTEIRAKAIRPLVERLVTIAKKQNLAARRLVHARLGNNRGVTRKLCEEIAPRYRERNGGYLRIVKLGKSRKRDSAPLARIEFV